MRIGIDAHILGKGKGGVERVVHQMVTHLPDQLPAAEFIIFTNRRHPPTYPARAHVRFVPLPVSDPVLQRSLVLPWLARRERLDLLHVQRAAPPAVRARLIVHVHDLLPITAPQDHPGWRDRLVRWLTPGAVRRADRVLTVSESVAAEIRQLYPVTVGKTAVVPNGIDHAFFRPAAPGAPLAPIHQQLGLTGPYFLYLGALMERKNLLVTLAAYAEFLQLRARQTTDASPPPPLVLAGMCRSPDYEKKLRAIAAQLPPGSVKFAGYVPEAACLALLQHAQVFIAPSRGEGFDLPALEAMACGVPVICSELPVHRELLDDDALYFPPAAPLALAEALLHLHRDPALRARRRADGLARAARYTWPAAMRRLADLYLTLSPSSSHTRP